MSTCSVIPVDDFFVSFIVCLLQHICNAHDRTCALNVKSKNVAKAIFSAKKCVIDIAEVRMRVCPHIT